MQRDNTIYAFLKPLLIVVIATGFLAAVSGCSDPRTPAAEKPVRAIKWFEIAEPMRSKQRLIAGVVEASEHAELSFEVAGQILQLPMEIGDRVHEGEVLAQLDREPYTLAVRSAEAQQREAQARHISLRNTYERIRKLYRENVASKQELDEARAAADVAQADVNAAAAQLRLARRDLRNTVLRAPFDGIIARRMAEPFEEIAAGLPVLMLEADTELEVSLAVPETLYRFLVPDDPVTVRFPVLDAVKLSGSIKKLGPRAAPANAFPAIIRLHTQHERLHAGMTAEVSFTFPHAPQPASFRIPFGALVAGSADTHYIYVFSSDTSRVQRTPVQLHDFDDNQAEVSGELQPGDIIAAAGAELLADGQQVTLMPSDPRRGGAGGS